MHLDRNRQKTRHGTGIDPAVPFIADPSAQAV